MSVENMTFKSNRSISWFDLILNRVSEQLSKLPSRKWAGEYECYVKLENVYETNNMTLVMEVPKLTETGNYRNDY